jgi:hypothetical protein
MSERHCSSCSLCCRLLPTKEIDKPANTRCRHQRHGKGCAIYARRPFSCMAWSCRWLVNDDTADLSRPDRSHYVIDSLPDFITMQYDDGETIDIPVLQIWVDPSYPDAHRDPQLRAYLERRGRENGAAAIIRYSSSDGFVLFPPSLTGEGWIERTSAVRTEEHSLADTFSRFGGTVEVEVR